MTDPNDQAYPRSYAFQNPEAGQSELKSVAGLTKREFFAAMAMNGVASWDALLHQDHPSKAGKDLAIGCVRFADALIAELNKEVKP